MERAIEKSKLFSQRQKKDMKDRLDAYYAIHEKQYGKGDRLTTGETVEAEGYSEEHLVEKDGFTSVAAYRFLVQLRENKDEAENVLRNGTVRKEWGKYRQMEIM